MYLTKLRTLVVPGVISCYLVSLLSWIISLFCSSLSLCRHKAGVGRAPPPLPDTRCCILAKGPGASVAQGCSKLSLDDC